MLPVLLAALLLLPAGAGAVELKYRGLEPGNSNRWPGKGLLTDPGVAWILRERFPVGTVADEGIVLVNPGGEVVLVDPKTGKVARWLGVVPGLRGPLLVARVKGEERVVGIRWRVSRSGEVRRELVTVGLRSGGVKSIRLPAMEGSVVGCLDVDGDGDDEALVLSDGLCCCELSPLRLRWRVPDVVVSVAVVPGDRPRAWATVCEGVEGVPRGGGPQARGGPAAGGPDPVRAAGDVPGARRHRPGLGVGGSPGDRGAGRCGQRSAGRPVCGGKDADRRRGR